jgi:hypothetical protein
MFKEEKQEKLEKQEKEKTLQWIQNAALSTKQDLSREKINPAIAFIFQRFQAPITHSFARTLGNNLEKAEEYFAEFSVYLIENRKQIFRGFDPQKGSLQSYLYKIAHRLLTRKKEALPVSLESLLETESPQLTPDQVYERDCVNTMLNLAMKALKVKNQEGYALLKVKYLSGEKIHSRDLAIEGGKLDPQESDKETIKKAQNLMDQQISKARKDLKAILERKIQKTVSFLEEPVDLAEEFNVFKVYAPWTCIEE